MLEIALERGAARLPSIPVIPARGAARFGSGRFFPRCLIWQDPA